jgi:hypothetical protein
VKYMRLHLSALALCVSTQSVWAADIEHKNDAGSDTNTPPVLVHIVRCATDGMHGPSSAPSKGITLKPLRLDAHLSERLAYYGSSESGVLGPRGWHCFMAEGSNGSVLLIAPKAITKLDESLSGPAIQATSMSGETSGRFGVAKVIARVFPAHMDFAKKVIAEDIEPASDFPSGPYPSDKLTYRNDSVVEYHTPPNAEGLGTVSRLRKDSDPIDGVAIFATDDDASSINIIAVKLPSDMDDLKPIIIKQYELDGLKSDQ